MSGTLYVVATPLGNLDDLSPRAALTLKQAAAVAAEDTRHTKTLLVHVGSDAELVSFHAHSPASALRRILHLLGTGKDVALVTDAGTPTVRAPGPWSSSRVITRRPPPAAKSRSSSRGPANPSGKSGPPIREPAPARCSRRG